MVNRRNKVAVYYLVQWHDFHMSKLLCSLHNILRANSLCFCLEDKTLEVRSVNTDETFLAILPKRF